MLILMLSLYDKNNRKKGEKGEKGKKLIVYIIFVLSFFLPLIFWIQTKLVGGGGGSCALESWF